MGSAKEGDSKAAADGVAVRIEHGGESVVVKFTGHGVTAEGFGRTSSMELRRPKTADEIRADIGRPREDMSLFLSENRAMNEAQGLPPVGPAATAIGKDLVELAEAFRSIVYTGA